MNDYYAVIVYWKGKLLVVLRISRDQPYMPEKVLDEYAKQYAFERSNLTCHTLDIVDFSIF